MFNYFQRINVAIVNNRYGGSVFGSGTMHVTDSQIYENSRDGFNIDPNGSPDQFAEDYDVNFAGENIEIYENNGEGLSVMNGGKAVISNSKVYDNDYNGLHAFDRYNSGLASTIKATDVWVEDNGRYGVLAANLGEITLNTHSVILYTGLLTQELKEHALRLGAYAVFAKPDAFRDLLQTLNVALEPA